MQDEEDIYIIEELWEGRTCQGCSGEYYPRVRGAYGERGKSRCVEGGVGASALETWVTAGLGGTVATVSASVVGIPRPEEP